MSTAGALADVWRRARDVVVLTGAGLSTASGIPDFRSPGGRWERYRPVPLREFLASERARETCWRYKGETWQILQAAEPNPGHVARADLARAGRSSTFKRAIRPDLVRRLKKKGLDCRQRPEGQKGNEARCHSSHACALLRR